MWERLGKRTPERGQVFIGQPHDENGKNTGGNWLHRLFPPLTEVELADMEAALKVTLPDGFRRVYRTVNGLSLFDDMVVMHGWVNERTAIFTMAQGMYSIRKLNTADKPWDALPQHFFFGSMLIHSNTFNYIYLDTESNRIFLTEHEYTVKPRASWNNLPELLTTEFDRVEQLFSPNGQRLFKYDRVPDEKLKQDQALHYASRVANKRSRKQQVSVYWGGLR